MSACGAAVAAHSHRIRPSVHPWGNLNRFCPPLCLQLVTKAPADCMCRPCTAVEDEVTASEVTAGYSDPGSMLRSFVKMY